MSSENIGRISLDLGGDWVLPDNYVFGHLVDPDTTTNRTGKYAAVKQGNEFHAMPFRVRFGGWRTWPQTWGYVYGPVHPSTNYDDVEGATYAYDDGTYWRFAHCSPHEQIDFAADAKTFTFDQFSPAIHRASVSTDSDAAAKTRALVSFAEQSSNEVFNRVKFAVLGQFHKDPHKDHKRDLALAAIDKVWGIWLKNGSLITQRNLIKPTYDTVRATLAGQHTIDWRFQRDDEKAARGDDPIAGNEYVYTLVATKAKITDATKLPDANWHFDAQPVGGYRLASGQTYWDAEPTRTDELPYIIRFKRPIPDIPNLSPGKSIGAVEWTQEAAY